MQNLRIILFFLLTIFSLNARIMKLERSLTDFDTVKQEIDILVKKYNVDSIVINNSEKTLYSHGNINKSTNLASVRKSVISLLYGIAIEKKLIDVKKTLKELGIDEKLNPLSEIEKSATIKDLLMARSGVYLESGAESAQMKKLRPARGQYLPGEYYYYNNWDFNVLGYIFEQETKLSIGQALYEWIGKEVGFEDFKIKNVTYQNDSTSDYKTWRIYMSARDLGKIGSLLLNKGNWNGKNIIPSSWIKESTKPYSQTTYGLSYGYLWWVNIDMNVYMGIGSGGQYLIVDEKNNITLSIRKDTGKTLFGRIHYKFFDEEITLLQAKEIYEKSLQLLK